MRTGIFTDFKLPTKGDVKQLHYLRADDVYLGLNDESEDRFRLRWNKSDPARALIRLEDTCKMLQDEGFTVHIMPWLRPYREYSEQVAEICLTAYDESKAIDSILFDCERYFIKAKLPYGATHLDALDDYWYPIWQDGIVYGVTSYAFMPSQLIALASVSEVLYGIPQAYSIYNPNMAWTLEPSAMPGRLQRTAYRKWIEYVRVVMGLPAYRQSRPGMTQTSAMKLAFNATKDLYVDANAYWSLKALQGKSIRSQFVRGLKDAR